MFIKKKIKTIVFIIIIINLSSCEWKTTKKDSTNNVFQTDISTKIPKNTMLTLNKSSYINNKHLRNDNEIILKLDDIKNGDTIFFNREKGYDKLFQDYFKFRSIGGKMRNDINEKYPYGPKEIRNNTFPSNFFHYTQKGYYDTAMVIYDLYKVCKFYFMDREDTLCAYWGGDNLGDDALFLPKIKSAQYLSIDENESPYFSYSANVRNPLNQLEYLLEQYVVYRFPDIQNNEIYLTSYEANKGSYSYWPFYTEYGDRLYSIKDVSASLFIINKTTKHNSIIKVLSFEIDDFDVDFRFFEITKDKKIIIYKMVSKRLKDWSSGNFTNEYDIWLRKSHIISINNDSKIEIEKINNNDKH